jgi:uncharacterized protein YndB with AHSA1/START domain
MRINDEPVIVEQSFKTSQENLWRAITDINRMRNWYFDNLPAFKPEVGFETQFNVHNEGRDFLHLWKVTEVIPLEKITYNWKYKGFSGDSFVTFEIIEENDMTTLRLSTRIVESFPEDIPEFSRESCLNGWTYFIKKRLKEYLEQNNSE